MNIGITSNDSFGKLANGKSIAEGLMNLFEPVKSFSQAVALPLPAISVQWKRTV
jgi:hypothetical protein